ncbi:MAG: hypothetical protein MZV63_44330 [Marinilabiliales bacterium]|nr:hypothetical protein [Marinilabiliales bacterium]
MVSEGPDEWVDNISTPEKETMEEIIAMSIRSAVDTLTSRYGKVRRDLAVGPDTHSSPLNIRWDQ